MRVPSTMAAKTALATARMSHMLKTYNGMEAKRSPKRKRPIVIDWVFLFSGGDGGI